MLDFLMSIVQGIRKASRGYFCCFWFLVQSNLYVLDSQNYMNDLSIHDVFSNRLVHNMHKYLLFLEIELYAGYDLC